MEHIDGFDAEVIRVGKNAARYAWKQVPMLEQEHLALIEARAFELFSNIPIGDPASGVQAAQRELLELARSLQQSIIASLISP